MRYYHFFFTLFIITFLFTSHNAHAEDQDNDGWIDVSECGTLSTEGENYELVGNIVSEVDDTDFCLDITADDISLRGNGFLISKGGGTSTLSGLRVGNLETLDNIDLDDLMITGFDDEEGGEGEEVSSAYGIFFSADNSSMSDISIVESSTALYLDNATNLNISNLNVSSAVVEGLNGIYLEDGENITIESSTFFDYTDVIDIAGSQNVTIQNNSFTGADDGIDASESINDNRHATGITVQNNSFNNLTSDAIVFRDVIDVLIANNTITDVEADAIDLGSDGRYIQVLNNTITTVGDNAFEIDAFAVTIDGNTVSDVTDDLIDADDISHLTFTNNTASGIGDRAFDIESIYHSTIEDNTISSIEEDVLRLGDGSENFLLQNNTFNNFGTRAAEEDPEHGLLLFTPGYYAIQSNIFNGENGNEFIDGASITSIAYENHFSYSEILTYLQNAGVKFSEDEGAILSSPEDGSDSVYRTETIDLTPYISQEEVEIMFHFFTDDLDSTGDGVYLDDITLTKDDVDTYTDPASDEGDWTVNTPSQNSGWEITEGVGVEGSSAWASGYTDDQYTRLFRTFDLSGAETASLTFSVFIDTEIDNDFFAVTVLPESGLETYTAERKISDNTFNVDGTALRLDLAGDLTITGNRFVAESWVSGSVEDAENNPISMNDEDSGNTYFFSDGRGASQDFSISDTTGNGFANAGLDRPFTTTTLGADLWSVSSLEDNFPGVSVGVLYGSQSVATQSFDWEKGEQYAKAVTDCTEETIINLSFSHPSVSHYAWSLEGDFSTTPLTEYREPVDISFEPKSNLAPNEVFIRVKDSSKRIHESIIEIESYKEDCDLAEPSPEPTIQDNESALTTDQPAPDGNQSFLSRNASYTYSEKNQRNEAGLSTAYRTSPTTEEFVSQVSPGWYIRSENFNTVYLITEDGKRRPFLNAQALLTHANWDDIIWITDSTLTQLPLGDIMLPKAGTTLVKISSMNDVYVTELSDNRVVLRKLANESIAEQLFGSNWNDYVIDIPPTAFQEYDTGEPIVQRRDFKGALKNLLKREDLK
jgi:parallel beta-helix repeat protein